MDLKPSALGSGAFIVLGGSVQCGVLAVESSSWTNGFTHASLPYTGACDFWEVDLHTFTQPPDLHIFLHSLELYGKLVNEDNVLADVCPT